MPEQRYNAYDHRMDLMINHNKIDLGIKPRSPDAQSNFLPVKPMPLAIPG
jgi:hypothetical protein